MKKCISIDVPRDSRLLWLEMSILSYKGDIFLESGLLTFLSVRLNALSNSEFRFVVVTADECVWVEIEE